MVLLRDTDARRESNPMALKAYINFCFKNYLRQHRYLRDLVAMVIFSIFFGGFLTSTNLDDNLWWMVLSVFAIFLNIFTAPAVFFLEKGNTLYFLLSKSDGRRNLLLSKISVIVLVDLFWILFFAVLYGLRFLSVDYFLLLPIRVVIVGIMILLSTLLISIAYSYRPQLTWLIFAMLIFGCIVRKEPLFPITSFEEFLKPLAFLLPPFFDMISFAISLQIESTIQLAFSGTAFLQIFLLFYLSNKIMRRKDLV